MKKIIAHGKLTTNDSIEATSSLINKTFSDYDINFMDYDTLVKMCHKFPRYFNVPEDALEEIVLICEGKDIPKGKNRLDMALSYLEFTRTKNISKKFEFTNKQKQLLFSAIGFLDLETAEGRKLNRDALRLYDTLTRIATRHSDDIQQQLEFAYKQFNKITEGNDVVVNHLVFSSNMALYFAKDSSIDEKLKKKIIKLATKIHDDVAKHLDHTEAYQNAADLCASFYAHIEKQDALYVDIKAKEINKVTDELMQLEELPHNFLDIIAEKANAPIELVNLTLSKRDDFE